MMKLQRISVLVACGAMAGLSLATSMVRAASRDTVALKDAARGKFHIGAAINARQITEKDERGVGVIERQFDTITPENVMKWAEIHPELERYDFELADRYVEFGEKRGMFIVGHTLMWHSQTPAWVFQDEAGDDVSKEELLKRLRDHIHTVVGRYKGRVKGWDVVNEAIKDEDGNVRLDRPWYRILGEEGILAAFKAAHEADPEAELYYNDYSLANPVKRAGVLRLVQLIRAKGLRIDGVGSQEHHSMEWPSVADIDATIRDFGQAGFKVMVTELDVTMLPRPQKYFGAEISKVFASAPELDPYRAGLPGEREEALAKRYGEIFEVYAKHAGTLTRVTLWGTADGNSWLNGWPIRGRTDYPLLFDRSYMPKPAFDAVLQALGAETGASRR